jgi:mucin-19
VGTLVGSTSNNNYTVAFTNSNSNTYKINPAILSITASKVYDGTTTFAASSVSAVTTIGNQVVSLIGSGTSNSADVIGVSSFSTTGLSIANTTFANNYVLPASTSNVSITPAPITVSIATQTKVYDTTNTAVLNSGSYNFSGFAVGQGASINQTSAIYNSANVASAITVSTVLSNASYVPSGNTNLANYSLPLSVSGSGTITRATLTMTANAATKFVGQADPTFTYTLTGLKGVDTSSVLVNPTVSRQAGQTATSDAPNNGVPYTITPSATAANYIIVPVTAGFTIVAQGQLLLTVGNTSVTYGTLKDSNLGASAAVSASYCTIGSDCSAPYIINLSITAGSTPNTWIATDAKAQQGKYNLIINLPSLSSTDSSTGGYLNVGSYTLTPSSTVTTVPGYATNYVTSYPVLTVAGTTSITPLLLNINTPSPSKVYDATNTMIGKTLTASNAISGDQLVLSGSGAYASVNAGTGLAYTINSVAISGADAANYAFTGTVAGTNGVITSAPLTVSGISANNKVYDATSTVTFSGTPALIGVVQGDTVTVTGAPTATFPQSDVGNNLAINFGSNSLAISNSNYYISGLSLNQTANITPAPITVNAAKLYDGSVSLTAADLTITGVNGQTLAVASGGATLTNANVGSAALQSLNNLQLANGTGLASNYTLTSSIFGTVAITPAPVTVTATAVSMVYGSAVPNLEYTYSGLVGSDSAVNFSGNLITTATNTSGIGSNYPITQGTLLAGGNYTITSFAPANLTITPASLTITANTDSKVYGSMSTNGGVSYSAGVAVGSSGYAVSGLIAGTNDAVIAVRLASSGSAANAAVNNGTPYVIMPSGASGGGLANYNITYVDGALTVTPAPITVTAAAKSMIYGAAVPNLTYTYTGLVANDTATTFIGSLTTSATNASSVGSNYLISQGTLAASGNYAITSYIPANVTITPAPLVVTASSASKVYGAGLPSLTYTYAGLVGSDTSAGFTGSLTSTATSSSNVGTNYPINQGSLLAGGNYTVATYIPGNLTITPAPLAVTATATSMVYGSAVPTLAYTYVGLVNGDASATITGSLATTATSSSNVGSNYPINQASLMASGNYTITSFLPANVTITQAPLTISADSKSIAYGDRVLPTLTYTQTGLIGSDQITGTLAAPTNLSLFNGNDGSASPVSTNTVTYPIGQGTINAGSNYAITYVPANVNVTPKALTIYTAPIASITYGTSLNLSSAAAAADGLINGDYITSVSARFINNGSTYSTIGSLTPAGTYAGSIQVVPGSQVGLGLSNYNPSYRAGDLSIGKANLTVTVASDAKLVTTSDTPNYGGVIASGFKNGETLSNLTGTAFVIRSNPSMQAAGSYPGVLTASGLDSNNYTINYVPGTFTILPANTLLVKLGNVNASYGSAISYVPVASYLTSNNVVISSSNGSGLTVSTNGNQISVIDNAGGQYQFIATPIGGQVSSSGNLNAGAYQLSAGSPVISGSNFTSAFVVGAATVQPRALTVNQDFTLGTVSKVYDGNTAINAAGSAITPTANSNIVTGDIIQISATGSYGSKNVGSNIQYSIDVNLGGKDSGNYFIAGGSAVTANNGVITQLTTPVAWVGPTAGGNWSNPNNWAAGAIPDFANVKYITIPAGTSVVYDSGLTAPVETIAANGGNITFNTGTASTIPMVINGNGTVTVAANTTATLTGDNAYTGNAIIGANTTLIAGSNTALGAGKILGSGGSFGVLTNIVLPSINVTGVLNLISDINTSGTQSYGNITLGSGTIRLAANNAAISLLGTVDATTSKAQSLVINAGSGVVTIGDSIGSTARLGSLDITGGSIYILADILTATSQQYHGNIFIGDASYLGKNASVGFLLNSRRSYFEYQRGSLTSKIDYLNTNPIFIRTMISEDPQVVFDGAVNDTVTNTHTLLVAAIAPTRASAAIDAPVISFKQTVGLDKPLYSLNSQTAINQTAVPITSTDQYVGHITIVGGAATYASQTYSAADMTASATSAGGVVKFSVYDPAAKVTFMLPTHTTNGVEQLNLYNGNFASLAINGATNYSNNQNNGSGAGQWASTTLGNALGYVPTPPAQPLVQPLISGGALREALDYHLNQVQANIGQNTTMTAEVSVSIIEEDEPSKSVSGNKSKTNKKPTDTDCGTDPGNAKDCGKAN